jgi:predicted MPP superfamily phosphohydrolase
MYALLLSLALLGHGFLWVGLANRLHALGIRRRIISVLTLVFFLCAATIPLVVGGWLIGQGNAQLLPPSAITTAGFLVGAYLAVCCVVAPVTLARFLWLRVVRRRPSILRFQRRRPVAIDPAAAAVTAEENRHHFLVRLPFNEMLQLEVADCEIDVPRLEPALDGLSIVHLSDLHFTGHVGKAYFREVVRASNELRPDLVLITGDLVDSAACVGWIADTLGQLAARAGVYFTLGNHDRRVDVGRLRRELEQCGLTNLGGCWRQVEFDGMPLVLVGNERPWLDSPDMQNCPPPAPAGPLRIVLAHTPDQFAWARAQGADLLLTGHTHGGQIRIPPLGAIFSPTFSGVKYISGVFYEPPTILHVSRGVSGDIPVRWNCPPEIAHLKLRAGRAAAS